ncbi:cellulose binding domain-containing protein [Kitasatospora sp. NA04385]|uniref:cellulose-binding domain-containing protein n=1 Tax=Kitasatospora sp. NA04385 TaxID=2742135 RepID=UPI0015923789|nr:cellulose-binding domain-containing protein [Kitasatospora sp. NA04385]QKW22379.1 cellulose binding domain-containing protein [Kitasatospora sp. NA04385]
MVHDGARTYGSRRGRGAVLAVLAVVLGLLAGFGQGPAPAWGAGGAACRVSWVGNEWTGGFTAQVTVTNTGAAVGSWKLSWTFAAGQQVTSGWNAQLSQSGTAVTASSLSYNGTVASGSSVSFGLQGTWSGSDPAPADFAFNGASCQGGSGTPTPTPTPSPTPTPTPPASPSPSPSPTPTPTPTPTGGCFGAVVCSGFEDQSGSTLTGDWTVAAPDCAGAGTVTVDTSVAHGGSRSLRVDGRAGYCNHVFAATTKDVSAVGPVVYARYWVRHTTALPADHIAMVTMADAANGGKHLRLGGQNGALQWNRESDDATLPAQSPVGVAQSLPLPVGQWVCVRFAVDTTKQSMDTWLNDQQVPGLHDDGVPTADIDQQWLTRTTAPRPVTLDLGWEAYGNGADTLWYDDVALGSAPIAC